MIKQLRELQAHCDAIGDMFHKEACHFTRPRAMLEDLFGHENCHFRRTGGFFVLTLLPSQLKYTMRALDGGTRKEHFQSLARRALQSLPMMRIAAILQRKLLYNDKSLCANPFSLRNSVDDDDGDEADESTPRVACGKRQRDSDVQCSSAMQLLATRLECAPANITFRQSRAVVDGVEMIKCVVMTPTRDFQPYLYCATAASAEKHAVLAALICLK